MRTAKGMILVLICVVTILISGCEPVVYKPRMTTAPAIGSNINVVCDQYARYEFRDAQMVDANGEIYMMYFPTGKRLYGQTMEECFVLTFYNGKLFSWVKN